MKWLAVNWLGDEMAGDELAGSMSRLGSAGWI
jgi:hypothetical protein